MLDTIEDQNVDEVLSMLFSLKETVVDDSSLFEKLSGADSIFQKLNESSINMSDISLYHYAQMLASFLNELIDSAVRAGWDVEMIRSILPNARKIHNESKFLRHIRDWPNGNAGDFEVIDMIIDRNHSDKEFGLPYVLGKIAIDSPIAQQHREKVEIQFEQIKEVCKMERPNICSIACGSSRDMQKAISFLKESNARIKLIDFDQRALDESKKNLLEIQDQIDFIKIDIRKLNKLKTLFKESDIKFDLIYAGGLFDYFNTGMTKLIISEVCKTLVSNNGIFMFTNIAKGNPFKSWMEVLGNWHLIERSREEIEDLVDCSSFSSRDIFLEPTKLTWIAKSINS